MQILVEMKVHSVHFYIYGRHLPSYLLPTLFPSGFKNGDALCMSQIIPKLFTSRSSKHSGCMLFDGSHWCETFRSFSAYESSQVSLDHLILIHVTYPFFLLQHSVRDRWQQIITHALYFLAHRHLFTGSPSDGHILAILCGSPRLLVTLPQGEWIIWHQFRGRADGHPYAFIRLFQGTPKGEWSWEFIVAEVFFDVAWTLHQWDCISYLPSADLLSSVYLVRPSISCDGHPGLCRHPPALHRKSSHTTHPVHSELQHTASGSWLLLHALGGGYNLILWNWCLHWSLGSQTEIMLSSSQVEGSPASRPCKNILFLPSFVISAIFCCIETWLFCIRRQFLWHFVSFLFGHSHWAIAFPKEPSKPRGGDRHRPLFLRAAPSHKYALRGVRWTGMLRRFSYSFNLSY